MHDRRSILSLREIEERRRFVVSFHGKLSYSANQIALADLHDIIAPQLDEDVYELRIIGTCDLATRKRFPRLHFTGFVPLIEQEIRDSDVCVLPLRVSVGFPNKAMEALAAGVPIIATAEVVEGLPSTAELLERGVYVRKVEEFLPQIHKLRELPISERQKIAAFCRSWVIKVYQNEEARIPWGELIAGPQARFQEPVAVPTSSPLGSSEIRKYPVGSSL